MPFDAIYLVHLEELDAQHKYFFHMLDCVEAAIAAEDNGQIHRLVEELLRYAKFHFASEEALMANYAYSGDQHRGEHVKLLAQVGEMVADKSLRPSSLRLFLYEWLVDHIQKEDRNLASFVIFQRKKVYQQGA